MARMRTLWFLPLILLFVILVILLSVLYVLTHQPPVWAIAIVLGVDLLASVSCAFWYINTRGYSRDDSQTLARSMGEETIYNPSTVGIPPSSQLHYNRPTSTIADTMTLMTPPSLQSNSVDYSPPPPTYHAALDAPSIILQHYPPPSYRSKEEDDTSH